MDKGFFVQSKIKKLFLSVPVFFMVKKSLSGGNPDNRSVSRNVFYDDRAGADFYIFMKNNRT